MQMRRRMRIAFFQHGAEFEDSRAVRRRPWKAGPVSRCDSDGPEVNGRQVAEGSPVR